MARNSYQSFRRDALIAGAGYLAYKGYKKLDNMSDRELLALCLAMLLMTALPAFLIVAVLAIPFYVLWRCRVFSLADKKLDTYEGRLSCVQTERDALVERMSRLPLTEEEKVKRLMKIDKGQKKVKLRILANARLLATRLEWRRRKVLRKREKLIRTVGVMSAADATASLERTAKESSEIQEALGEFKSRYNADPLKGWLFVENFSTAYFPWLAVAAGVLWIPTLFVLLNI